MLKKIVILSSLVFMYIFTGCEDPAPFDYVEDNFVEAYLIVDEPIQNVRIMRSLSLADSFKLKQSVISDADVRIISDNTTFNLAYRDSSAFLDYYYPDSTVLVKPNTTYKLEVRLKNGKFIKGQTTTPGRIEWIKKLPDILYYPKDTLKLNSNDTLKLSWTKEPGTQLYLISVVCTDTLEYGKYLTPPTEEKNRRISRPWERESPDQNEVTRWGLVLNNEAPVVWTTIKWFGKNEINVYAADYNFLRWFVQYTRKSQADPLLSSVEGAYGVFGSASKVSQPSFVVKNQP